MPKSGEGRRLVIDCFGGNERTLHHSKMMSELRTQTITEDREEARSHLFLIENYVARSCVISEAFRFVNEAGRTAVAG